MKLEKITENSESRRRRYADACAAAHGMDLLGERWALLVIRELIFGPRRFADLRASLPGLSANVLTQRLEGLEAAGVLRRERLPPPAAVQVYRLTEWGLECEAVLQTLGRWAARSPWHDPTQPISAASFLLSLRTMLDPARSAGLAARIALRLGPGEDYALHLEGGRLAIARGAAGPADLRLEAPPAVLAGAIYGGQALAALEASGALRLEGDRALAERFVTLFPLPGKAPAAPAGS